MRGRRASLRAALIGLGIALAPAGAGAAARRASDAPSVEARTPTELQGTRRIALVVGVNDGGNGRARLRYADKDALALARVLADLGGVDAGDRLVLDDPDIAGLRRGFERTATRVRAAQARGERVELIFYYSGHSDESGLLIGEELVGYRDLRAMIDAIPAEVRIAILDSCASGAFTRLKGGTRREPFLVGGPSVMGHAFLTSSSADEAAQESDRIRGSFFTHYLVTGLRGAADANGDRLVTLNEAYRFAFDETLARTEGTQGGPQHAAYEIQLAGSGDLVITDLRESTASVEIAAAIGGRVFIRDSAGNLEAELHKPAGAGPIALALEPGTYRITVDDGASIWRASVTIRDGESALIDAGALIKLEPEKTVARGPEGPEPPPPPAPEVVPFNIGLTPKLSLNGRHGGARLTNRGSISFGYDRVARIEGASFALGAGVIDEGLIGLQTAGGLARLNGEGLGVQAALITSAGARFTGLQWSGLASVADEELRGLQASAIFNYAGELRGVQAAGIASYAARARGLQLGLVNTSGSLRGASIGLVNVTRGRVDGLQLGLVNFADDADVSIGLLPISRKGGIHLDVWTSDLAALNLGLRLASRRTYALLTAGLHPFGAGASWMVGAGLGGRFRPTERLFIDVDNVIYGVQPGLERPGVPRVVDSLRLMLGWQPHRRFSIYGGPTANFAVDLSGTNEHFRPGYPYASYRDDWLLIWPGFVFGVSI
ncbi:MAG: caspase family protein [Myxococcales bacterium]|nr:caspase family protein [Myxococcales bacterium]